MEDEKLLTGSENDEIAEYYKNLNTPEEEEEKTESADESVEKGADVRTILSDPEDFDDPPEMFDAPYMPRRGGFNFKWSLLYCMLVLLAAMIALFIVYAAGNSGEKREDIVEAEYKTQLAESSKYNDLKKSVSAIKEEIEDLTKTRDEKQAVYDALTDYELRSSDADDRLDELQKRLDDLNDEIEEKQKKLDKLNEDKKTPSIVNLIPGRYSVGEGKNIAAGKYSVTGSGSIVVSASSGSAKLNSVLGTEGIVITLDEGDIIKLDTNAKFTPVN